MMMIGSKFRVQGSGPPWCDPHCGLGQGFKSKEHSA